MTLFCKNCDSEFLGSSIEHENLLLTLREKTKRYTPNKTKLDEVDKILYYCITIYNKNLDIFFTRCRFEIEFDNIF